MDQKNELDSLRKSKWKTFDLSYAENLRQNHPEIWALGGNILGNDQFRRLSPIAKRDSKKAESDTEMLALKLREAWIARHYEDFRIAGVVAQIKWLAVGSRGEQYMKNLIEERIKRMEEVKHSISLNEAKDYLEHFGVKGMRWGVRNDTSSGGSETTGGYKTKVTRSGDKHTTIPRKDSKYLSTMASFAKDAKVQAVVNKKANEGAARINSSKKYQSLKGQKPNAKNKKLFDEYLKDHVKNLEDAFDSTLRDVSSWYRKTNGVVPSGKAKFSIKIEENTGVEYFALTEIGGQNRTFAYR